MNRFRNKPALIRAEIVNPSGETLYNGFSYAFELFDNHESFKELFAWCQDRYGAPDVNGEWFTEYKTMATVALWFRESAQAMEFKLRWA